MADANAASEALKSSISPLFSTMITIAAVACLLFIVFGGYYYMTSAGNPEKLDRAKKTLRNAFIGFVVVLAAGALVSIMQNAYSTKTVKPQEITSNQVTEPPAGNPLTEVVNKAITGFISSTVESLGKPIVDTLKQFTTATPLMASNGAVFNLWMVIVAIVDVLFLLVIGLIGFRIMSASVIGFEEVDIRSLIPQILLTFILANVSIFAIDAIITLSNAMIHALLLGMSNEIIWTTLGTLVASAATLNIGILFLIAIALILAAILLVYYLQRLIVLYVGAVLSPLIVLLWLLPSFRDFAVSAAKTYIITIFVLFVHVVILMLAVSLFAGLGNGEGNDFITAFMGIATLAVLLRTGQTMNQMAMMSTGSQGLRKLGSTFVRSASHMANTVKKGPKPTTSTGAVKSGGISVSGARPTTPASTALTRQVTHRQAAGALTTKKANKEVMVTAGSKPNQLTMVEKPVKSIPKAVKGGAK